MNKHLKITLVVLTILSLSVANINAAIPEDRFNVTKYLEGIYSRIVLSILPKLDTIREDQYIRYDYTIDDFLEDSHSFSHSYSISCDKPFEIAAIFLHVDDPQDGLFSYDQLRLGELAFTYIDKVPQNGDIPGYTRYYEMGSADLHTGGENEDPVAYLKKGVEVLNACGITVRPNTHGEEYLYSNFFRLSVGLKHANLGQDYFSITGNEVIHFEIVYYAPPGAELSVIHTDISTATS